MDQVVIGVDPHKLSVTIEARDRREILRATGRFGTGTGGCRQLLVYARQWPDRVWAVKGANGVGRPLAQRLLASGEPVLDVPAKLAARARVFDTGQGRKTDPADAHAIVMVALRDKRLRELTTDPGPGVPGSGQQARCRPRRCSRWCRWASRPVPQRGGDSASAQRGPPARPGRSHATAPPDSLDRERHGSGGGSHAGPSQTRWRGV